MRKFVILAGVLGALAVPAAAQAGDAASMADRHNAAQECRFECGTTAATREAFALKYGINDAFGKWVSKAAREERAQRAKAKTGRRKRARPTEGMTIQPITYHGRTLAACTRRRVFLSHELETLAPDDRTGLFVFTRARRRRLPLLAPPRAAEPSVGSADPRSGPVNGLRGPRGPRRRSGY
jgi:hypothetical protein